MKVKKIAALCITAGLLSLIAAGCNSSVQTEEEIVIPKEQIKEEGKNDEGHDGETIDGADQDVNSEGIMEQVQAPENYTWEGASGKISVKVDAQTVIPQAEGFKSYKVTSRAFTQEDYDEVNKVLLGGAILWDRDYDEMAESNGWSKEEIEEKLTLLREQKAAYEAGEGKDSSSVYAKEETYDQMIAEWEDRLKKAPDTPIVREVPVEISYSEDSEENWLNGYATVDGQDYFVSLDNALRADWKWICFEVRRKDAGSNFMSAGKDVQIESTGISIEKAKQEAQKLVADMGFTDFELAGEEPVQTLVGDELSTELVTGQFGYGFHFTRVLDGIPVTYTNRDCTLIEEETETVWPYEALEVVMDQEGCADFLWRDPYQIEKVSDDYVFLLPFSDVQSIFEEMIIKKYEDFFGDLDVEIEFNINEVQLGYMRIMEKGNPAEGIMVPVWDFFGSETLKYEGMGETYTEDGPYASWLTINAMDGTIIDRALGY